MSRTLTLAFGLAVLGLFPGIARAQLDPRGVSFGIGGGVSLPVGVSRGAYVNGFNGSLFLSVGLGSLPLAVRADLTYQSFVVRHEVIPAAALPGGATGTLLGGLGDVQLVLRRGTVSPYVLAGFGAYAVKTEYDSNALAAASERRIGAHGGLGLLLSFGSLSLYAEGTLDHVLARSGATSGPVVDVVPLTVGVIF